jgi:hypothetical protein
VFFKGDRADMLIRIVSRTEFAHRFDETRRHPTDRPVHDIQVAMPTPTRQTVFLTVMYPLKKNQQRPDITVDRSEERVVINVAGADRKDSVRWHQGKGLSVEERSRSN